MNNLNITYKNFVKYNLDIKLSKCKFEESITILTNSDLINLTQNFINSLQVLLQIKYFN